MTHCGRELQKGGGSYFSPRMCDKKQNLKEKHHFYAKNARIFQTYLTRMGDDKYICYEIVSRTFSAYSSVGLVVKLVILGSLKSYVGHF